ncbi:hypothetical protein RhiXN_01762 [Rhizoctonia solani]|uniref:Ribosome biogenesis protein NSA1 n=1 Tax=Rhizoctonia solani TaxID=456999 RepID=A0A8H8PC70_9AGAM|nr:uncharacterized protein RhiXN_01762 [Rhizoctonia solani]QRW27167.1 hypothetical protein RhiXN_01762 [Rhizoctonia solani]
MTSYRVFTGDDKGQLKSVAFDIPGSESTSHISTTTIQIGADNKSPLHRLQCHRDSDSDTGILATARADGLITTYSYTTGSNELKELSSWSETRMKNSDRFVGLHAFQRRKGWLTCTHNGRLRLSNTFGERSDSDPPADLFASLPMRLNDLRLSPSFSSLAYGGDEVDLSVWDVERTFSDKPQSTDEVGKKRKKGKNELMYAEIWRAKQLPNDSLSLPPEPAIILSHRHGEQKWRIETVRYANSPKTSLHWENIAKIGGIRNIEPGRNEYELFVSDNGSSLSSIDVRSGKICYSYKGLPSAATSFSPVAKSHLASVSLDRVFRLHTVYPPPPQANEQQLKKGEVIGQEFLKSTPTAIIWDKFETQVATEDGDEEDVWEAMEVRGEEDDGSIDEDESEDEQPRKARKRSRK